MIIVIGGGPAGIMAAASAALSGNKVTLIEKNPSFGKKLLLTGGGRCNLTHACDAADLIDHFSKTGKFLRDAFKEFGKEELLSFFRERGLDTKAEKDGRIFPVTDKASSVLNVLIKELNKLKVNIILNKGVKDVIVGEEAIAGVLCADGKVVEAKSIIWATGGISYKETGSTGKGIELAEKLGHKIISLRQGLVPLDLKGQYSASLEGVSLFGVKLVFRTGKKKLITEKNSLMFTRTGISGPVVLSYSAKVVDWLMEGAEVSVEIDVRPDESAGDLDKMFLKKFSKSPGKSLKNILKEMLPVKFVHATLSMTAISPDKRVNQITAQERKALVILLKSLKFDVSKKIPFERARVTRGGVSTKDIDPATMESKKVKGLYFAGEMIDVDGECGGFNLQAAFSTGYLAGKSASQRVKS